MIYNIMPIKIIYDCENFLVIDKSAGICSAPLNENETDNALFFAIQKYPEIKKIDSKKKIEYGLIHRIDTATRGLLLIAKNQSSYNNLIKLQNENKIEKEYTAFCSKQNPDSTFPVFEKKIYQNLIEGKTVSVKSYFRSFSKKGSQVRPVSLIKENNIESALKKSGKKVYETIIQLEKNNSSYMANCRITNGFRHQVRCHLAWCGFPVQGDILYERDLTNISPMKFEATGLSFPDWESSKKFHFSIR